MGNIPGSPEFPFADIQRIASEVMGTFGPEYTKQYALSLIAKLEAELEPDNEPDWQLKSPPPASEPLMEGWATKQGAVRQSWKRRYFVALNEKDNYIIYYFANDADKDDVKKASGKVETCGYKPIRLTKEEDIKKFGENCIQLKPRGRRRNWYIRFDNAEDAEAWEAVFDLAGKKANPPLNEDQVMREAFLAAYERTRWALWVWSWWTADCTEEEMLSQLIVDRCERDIMHEVYAKISSGRTYWLIHNKMQDMLDSSVGAVVGAGWKAVVTAVSSQSKLIEDKAREVIGPVMQKKVEFKNMIKDAIVGTMSPILEEISKPVLNPVLEKMQAPIFNMFETGLLTFQEKMNEIIQGGMKPKDVKRFLRRINYYWGDLRPAYQKIRDLTRSDTMEILSDILYEVRWWHIEDQFEDRLRELVKRAVYTFCTEVEGGEGREPRTDTSNVLKEVAMKYSHDAQIAGLLDTVSIFEKIIMPPFRQKVIPAIKDLISPISGMIPDAIKMFLDPDQMVDDIMEGAVQDVIKNVVTASSKGILSKLDAVAAKVA